MGNWNGEIQKQIVLQRTLNILIYTVYTYTCAYTYTILNKYYIPHVLCPGFRNEIIDDLYRLYNINDVMYIWYVCVCEASRLKTLWKYATALGRRARLSRPRNVLNKSGVYDKSYMYISWDLWITNEYNGDSSLEGKSQHFWVFFAQLL